ncbi:zinc finger protein 260-like isoform X5 [Spodoptera litura]|uniref:Zinc finger protein 260-like isoform X5 n=1 Tax=Spodoptera litura TaxID=69820 RepID=A0A9J7E087_SPOLT|nr:zinc finger protein 260-like isoform X5 [Spodoptera litura]
METAGHSNMCRCCASEGAFKDIKSTYHWMGEEEIYADMLKDCFDINLNVSEHGEDGGICEVCITQLRNAINFKKQVQHTEEQFKKHLQNKALFRPNIVKVEVGGEEDSDGDNMGSGDDAFSGAEFDVPIKTEEDDPKPKKRSKASATTTRSKKSKSDDGEPSTKRQRGRTRIIKIEKPTNPTVQLKFVSKLRINPDMLAKGTDTETMKNKVNVENILLNSNANPIRCKDSHGYGCAFCPKQFQDTTVLKRHFLQEHNNDKLIKYMSAKLFKQVIKLDITYLNCAICDTDITHLDDLISHLKSEHNKPMYLDVKSQILPFRFDTPQLKCAICSTEFVAFKLLQEHMNMHFGNYICEICGAGFVTDRLKISHVRRHASGEYKCKQCDKTFTNDTRRREHEKRTHLGISKRNKCNYCAEKFVDYWKKVNHMVQEHGMPPVVLKCSACDRTFSNQRALSTHTRKDHLLERRHKCNECEMRFFLKSSLQKHMAKHTGLRQFKCDICLKAYGRKNTLREHMRIHANDRRFACSHCGQAFVQKCSWRNHMRAVHKEHV